MTLLTVLLDAYLMTGLFLGAALACALKQEMPGKLGRQALDLEKRMLERGVDWELTLMLLVLIWPMIFASQD